ncbi:hypothetical protein SDC9_29713 [bioreactor metagenome]|uniref:Uncharacterized protein n=1 Tax=bioreactor metagenome TaxID=1076179 RepID=A0A644UYC4_9ZZZZ
MVAVCAGLALACSLRGRAVHHFASPFDPFRLYRAELCAKRKQGVKLNFSMRKKELKSWRYVMRSLFCAFPRLTRLSAGKILIGLNAQSIIQACSARNALLRGGDANSTCVGV